MEKKEAKPAFADPIISALGSDLGRYQLIFCMLVFLSKFPSGWVTLSIVFLAAPVEYNCTQPANVTDACSAACEHVEYNRTTFQENIITEWDLICERKSLASLSQTIVMFGIMVGGIVSGIMADAYGRKWTFAVICTVQLIAGCLVSLAKWFWLFCALRFITAFATGGMMVISFVLIMEIVGKSYREIMSILYQIPFNLGHATLPLFAYYLRDWHWYHFGFSIFSVVYLVYYFTPESPRWLLTIGRVDEAVAILEKGARCNGQPTDRIRADLDAAHQRMTAVAPPKRANMLDLFRHRFLCFKTCILAFNWLNVCLAYYGVSQYISNLGGNIFINVALGAWLGVPGTIICVPMTKYLGRKTTLIISNAISAICLLLMAILPDISHTTQIILATGGLFGASITFPNVYMYSGELFPTVVRNSGMGLCSFIGRMGSMTAPFITQMASYGLWIPALVFGSFAAVACVSVLPLPETRGALLPETIEDGENFGKKPQPAQL